MIELYPIVVILVACILCTIRATLGPTAPDRVVAIEAMSSLMVTSLVLLGIFYRAPIYLDIALVYSFLLFLGTLAVSKYLEGRGIET